MIEIFLLVDHLLPGRSEVLSTGSPRPMSLFESISPPRFPQRWYLFPYFTVPREPPLNQVNLDRLAELTFGCLRSTGKQSRSRRQRIISITHEILNRFEVVLRLPVVSTSALLKARSPKSRVVVCIIDMYLPLVNYEIAMWI